LREKRNKAGPTVTPTQHLEADNSWLANLDNWSLEEQKYPIQSYLEIEQLELKKEKYPPQIISQIRTGAQRKQKYPIQWPYLEKKYHDKQKPNYPSYFKMLIPSSTSKNSTLTSVVLFYR